MRGHKFLLGDAIIKSIFQKWLQKHRLGIRIRAGDEVVIKVSLQWHVCFGCRIVCGLSVIYKYSMQSTGKQKIIILKEIKILWNLIVSFHKKKSSLTSLSFAT